MCPRIEGASILKFDDQSWLLLHEDVGESYNAVTRSAAAAVGAEWCELALYDAESGALIARRPSYSAPGRAIPQYRFHPPTPASARVIETGEPYVSNDPGRDPLYRPSVEEEGVRSVLTVPVRRGRGVLGLLYALNKPGGFTPEDVATLQALAGAAAVTLENIRLYTAERDRRVLNESLREVSRALVGTPTEDAALAKVLDQMWRVVHYEAAAVLLLESGRLRVAASRGGESEVTLSRPEADAVHGALEARKAVVLPNPEGLLRALSVRTGGWVLVSPLLARSDALGAFVVVFDAQKTPGRSEELLVGAFADHAALFLEAGAVLRRERLARARSAALARVTHLAATRHEPEPLLQAVAPELLSLSGADRVVLYLTHPRNLVLIPVADAGAAREEEDRVRDLRLDFSNGPLEGLTGGSTLEFQEASNPPPGSITPFPSTVCQIVIPLMSREDLLGAALLAWVGPSRSPESHVVPFTRDVVQQVALGVENARLFARLAQLASTDELTGLANRRRFAETLRLELGRARRLGTPLSLVLGDLDHLKKINDTHGHPAGDAAIRHAAAAFRHGRRDTDLAARIGGEEFALILASADLAGAVKAAERIREHLAEAPLPTVGTVTVSLGVASFPDDASTEEALVRVADERLYAAKSGGRNRVCSVSLAPVAPGGTAPAPTLTES